MSIIVKNSDDTILVERDRFLFFLMLASIIHFFAFLNSDLSRHSYQKRTPLEVIFIKNRFNELDAGRALSEKPIDKTTKNIESETRPDYVEAKQDDRQLRTKPDESPNSERNRNNKILRPTAKQLIARSLAEASRHTELVERINIKTDRPRRKYISASTKEHKFAAYMESWRAKVERVGNINYPSEARKRRLSGDLLLDVAIRQNGTVQQITIRRSAGNKVLDRAAIKIVELAAPFAPLPEKIAEEVDILHITRTWKFVDDSDFTTR
ncbi:MAG: TonB family protein [Pseudomonadota bacterium]|nr:TonB family protein [Pseudomonadota bacterium]